MLARASLAGLSIGPDKAVAIAVQIEPARNQVVAVPCRTRGDRSGNTPLLAIELGELAADGETRQMFEQKTALAPTAKSEFADELFVSGFAARRRCDAGEQIAIGHKNKIRRNSG